MKALLLLKQLEKKCLSLSPHKYFCNWNQKKDNDLLYSIPDKHQSSHNHQSQTNHLNSPQALTKEAQKALWATKILRHICLAPKPKHMNDPSLREQLKKLQLYVKGYKLNDEYSECLKFFTEGVVLNQQIYDQNRVGDATQCDKNVPSSKKPVIFNPNVLATHQMAKLLINRVQKILIYGGIGISKTISIILVCQLSMIIHRFLYKAFLPAQNKQISLYHLEFENLKQHILHRIPRFWYWCAVKSKLQQQRNGIQEKMIMQAQQLTEYQRQQLRQIKDFQQFKTRLFEKYEIYNPSIIHRPIVDQINNVTSFATIWNYAVDRLFRQKHQCQHILQNILAFATEQEVNARKWFLEAKKQIQGFIGFGARHYILNSTGIEKSVIHVHHISAFKVNLQLQGEHEQLSRQQIKFHTILNSEWARIQFIHFFWFQYERLLKYKSYHEDSIKQIKQKFYKTFKDFKMKSYYRFLSIIQFIYHKGFLDRLSQNYGVQAIVKLIEDHMGAFDSYCIDACKLNLDYFKNKPKDKKFIAQRMMLMDIFYSQAVKYNFRGIQEMDFSVDYLNNFMGQCVCITSLLASEETNKQYLPCIVKDKVVHLIWSTKEFLSIVRPHMYKQLHNFYSQLSNESQQKLYRESRNTLGNTLQFRMRNLLQPLITFRLLYNQKIINSAKKEFIKVKQQQFQIFMSKQFLSFFKEKQRKIQKNMKQILKIAEENPGKYISGIPHTQKGVWSHNNSYIDFVIVNYNPHIDRSFQIYSFDISVQARPQAKIKKTEVFFRKMINQSALSQKYSIRHIIVCSTLNTKGLEKKICYISPQLRIGYCQLKHVDFRNKQSFIAEQQQFRLLRNFIYAQSKEKMHNKK